MRLFLTLEFKIMIQWLTYRSLYIRGGKWDSNTCLEVELFIRLKVQKNFKAFDSLQIICLKIILSYHQRMTVSISLNPSIDRNKPFHRSNMHFFRYQLRRIISAMHISSTYFLFCKLLIIFFCPLFFLS